MYRYLPKPALDSLHWPDHKLLKRDRELGGTSPEQVDTKERKRVYMIEIDSSEDEIIDDMGV